MGHEGTGEIIKIGKGVKNGTENGWKGLAMRSVLPKASRQAEIQQTLDEMVIWLNNL